MPSHPKPSRKPHMEPQSDQYEQFVRLYARHEPSLRAFVRSLLPTVHDVDEVVQETCLVLWRKFEQFEQGTEFFRWAATIARFEVLKYRRKLSRDRHVFSEQIIELLAAEGELEHERLESERKALSSCLEKLPQRQRELVRGCYAAGVTIKQVAEDLGRSATSLYKALNRIRSGLLTCIERQLSEGAA